MAGCRSSLPDQPEVAAVEGIVTLDGLPLKNATIVFYPESGRMSIGRTDADGQYVLRYNDQTPGAKIGNHKVSITTYRDQTDPDDINSPPFKEILPARFHELTELTAKVEPAITNTIHFDLKLK